MILVVGQSYTVEPCAACMLSHNMRDELHGGSGALQA